MTQGPYQSRAISGGPVSGEADTSSGDPQLIGRMISGKYRIEKFLGGGAMGAVYKANFAALEKFVAVKVMHRAVAVDPSFVARFHREAKAASRMDHPNSVRVIDFGEEPDGLLYIAMEFVDGRDLYRVIHEDWPISNADIGDVLMQALAAIAVGHEMGVIHRDLKPENLMILRVKNDDERDAYLVKVCDFGIAKITETDEEPKTANPGGRKLTTEGLVVGTPEYMSPEQAKGEKLDPRSDIYSLGVILYQLLTGRTPFTAETPLAVVLKHITEIPPPPSVHYAGVHKGLEQVCLRALAKDKAERWQTARSMRNAIREALEGRPLPVDAAAETLAMPGGGPAPGTNPMGAAGASLPHVVAQGMTAPGAAIESAPTVAGGMSGSHLTPLGTAAATVPTGPPKKSRAALFVGLVVVALLVVGGAIAAPRLLRDDKHAHDEHPIKPLPTTAITTATATATTTASAAPTTAKSGEPPAPPPADPKAPRHTTTAPTGHAPASAKATVEPPPVSAAIATPPPPPPTQEPPAPATTAPPPPPPPTVTAPPPPPPFNSATCRAAPGPVRGSGSTNAKDLNLGSAASAWTACARSAIREKPGAPIAATVHLRFSDNKAFRGASCGGCPAALAQCIQSSTTAGTVSVTFRGGDVTGDPAFDVPVTFSCE